MEFIAVLATATALSMDAFAVAVCKGLAMPRLSYKKAIIIGLWFGFFQALMPFIGYTLGVRFEHFVESFADWIAFILLALIGANMIKESLAEETECLTCTVDFKSMLVLAVATSIDALAAGVAFAFSGVENIFLTIALIGIITFFLSVIGVKIGNVFGTKYKSKAEFVGGVILILMGLKIIIEHYI